MNPHIEDIARRLALEGFVAFAPDALFPLGEYRRRGPGPRPLRNWDQAKTREDFVAAAGFTRTRPGSNGKLGVVGFCYGGGIANFLATRLPHLAAAVPFYGSAPPLDQVKAIKAALQLHFAANDERINASWPPYEAALKAAHVKYEAFTYPGTEHGFNNDTTPRYDPPAAKLAWQRTSPSSIERCAADPDGTDDIHLPPARSARRARRRSERHAKTQPVLLEAK